MWSEHGAINDESLLVAEEVGEADGAMLAFEGVVVGQGAAMGKGTAERGDSFEASAAMTAHLMHIRATLIGQTT